MLDSAIEPSYYLSKNVLLLPWILKLIVDMVNNSKEIKLLYINLRKENYAKFYIIFCTPKITDRKCTLYILAVALVHYMHIHTLIQWGFFY